ncbi:MULTISPECIES: hypothetical protein [Microbacterium]|uniref:hypothetical protein n=1 Tax=Microbacterium TaxID=33882 RepID=UPI000D65B439|nr:MULTISPECIES: hypothetical protein [Microbacterium]
MTASFTPERSDAVRELLIERATPRPVRRRRMPALIALVLAGAVAGVGISTAAFAATGAFTPEAPAAPSGQPAPDLGEPIAAPPGTVPGAPVISSLGAPRAREVSSAESIPLTDRPDAATHVRVTVTALTAGELNMGTDAAGDNPRWQVGASDLGGPSAVSWYDYPLDAATDALHVTPSDGFTATVTLQYVTHVPTHLGVNARGETFGAEGGPDGRPDLIAVVATSPAGGSVEGFARASDLEAFSPDHPAQPTDPDEAVELQAERDDAYPDGWDIPVYESDGVTRIGTFHISN